MCFGICSIKDVARRVGIEGNLPATRYATLQVMDLPPVLTLMLG